MSTTSSEASARSTRPERPRWAVWGERALEVLIRVSGVSAILFVLAIFFFVFREAFPVLVDDRVGVPVLTVDDLQDPAALLERIQTSDEPLASALRELLGDDLAELAATEPADLPRQLQRSLNRLIKRENLLHGLSADALSLSPRTQKLAATEPAGEALHWLNRFVLADAFPDLVRRGGRFRVTEFLFSTEWYPTSASNVRFGILALIVGTLSVSGLAVLFAVPFSLGAAVFISEFCGPRLKEALKIVIELLAAIPSVVWGFIGLTVMSKLIVEYTGAQVGVNILNGGIILALMCVPIITSIAEDALKAVPDTYREAALALGATRWQTVWRVLLPAAKNGLLAAVLLGVGRAVGETMVVLMATGHAVHIPHSILDSVRTLTANIAAELGEAPVGSAHYRVLFMTGVLLFVMTFLVNLTADLVVRGVRRKA